MKRVKEDNSVEIAYADNYRGVHAPFVVLAAVVLALWSPAQGPRRSRG